MDLASSDQVVSTVILPPEVKLSGSAIHFKHELRAMMIFQANYILIIHCLTLFL